MYTYVYYVHKVIGRCLYGEILPSFNSCNFPSSYMYLLFLYCSMLRTFMYSTCVVHVYSSWTEYTGATSATAVDLYSSPVPVCDWMMSGR